MINSEKITNALKRIGANDKARAKLLNTLIAIEEDLFELNFDAREEITAPLVDSLYSDSKSLQRVLDNGLIIHFPYSSKISREFVMATPFSTDHVWEPQTTKLLLELAKNAQHVLIGGAYWGDQTILVANSIKDSGFVHCFELNDINIGFLNKNASTNNLSNIQITAKALWDADNVSVNLSGLDSLETCIEVDSNNPNACKTITIDTYGKNHEISSFDLIMLDIEGGELKALKGAELYLSMPKNKAPNIIFEIHRSYVDWSNGLESTDIIKFLAGFGYIFFGIRDYNGNVPMTGKQIELVPINNIYLDGPHHGFNILAIKDPSIVESDMFLLTPGISPKLLKHRDPEIHSPFSKL